MADNVTRFLTPSETASLLRIDLRRFWDLARTKRLPGLIRIGRHYRVERESLEAWIAAGGGKPDSEDRRPAP